MHSIQFPDGYSEFDIQASLFSLLQSLGFNVRGGVPAICHDLGKRHRCFFDLVLFDGDKKPFLIIECKNQVEGTPLRELKGRQRRRYTLFGCPVWMCDRFSQIEPTVDRVTKDFYHFATHGFNPAY